MLNALSELRLKVIAALCNTATSNPGSLILMAKLVDTLFPRDVMMLMMGGSVLTDATHPRIPYVWVRICIYRMRAGE